MLLKWFTIGIGLKRWLLVLVIGVCLIACGIAFSMMQIGVDAFSPIPRWPQVVGMLVAGMLLSTLSIVKLSRNLLAPYRRHQQGRIIDVVYAHSKRQKGLRVVAIGGGTGLPSVLRGLKATTSNITAVVTVADDGGSSGRLRRDMGVLPPGDIRNNIAALADDESLITKLFQYRFEEGDLGGHAFGNLLIAALAGVSGGLENALPEVERVLNIQGRVLPATLDDVNLVASIRLPGKHNAIRVHGESKISEIGGRIETIALHPPNVNAYAESVQAILDADLIVIGPGSLYTSIIPNLLVQGIAEALRDADGLKVYVCNVATQPGETDSFTVADHITVLEDCIGRGVFQAVIANNAYPRENAGITQYVAPIPEEHPVLQRYDVHYTDLTDPLRPWRHDPRKLAESLLAIVELERAGSGDAVTKPVFTLI